MPQQRKKIVLAWNGDKNSAISLFELKSPDYAIVGLLTTFVGVKERRVQMHGIKESLIECQARSLELPLIKIYFEDISSDAVYESQLNETLTSLKSQGIDNIAFGDIFLTDKRKYRDQLLKKVGFTGVYPLWNWSAKQIQQAFFGLRFKALVTCIHQEKLHRKFLGRAYDQSFLQELPLSVDSSGKNGEFHTFTYDGLLFQEPVTFELENTFEQKPLLFQDLKELSYPKTRFI